MRVWSDARVQCFLVFLVLSFACPAYGIDITLMWDPNVEPDLAGYKIYYKTGSPGPPYNGWEAFEGNSPIAIDAYQALVGNTCEFTLIGLDEAETYYFVTTAYDAEGNESAYSNEVCFNCKSEYECDLTPDAAHLGIGETLGLQATVRNNTDMNVNVLIGTKLTKPDGTTSGWIIGPVGIYLSPHQSISHHFSHTIPANFEVGTYTYHGYVGRPGEEIFFEDQFEFEVTGE